MLHFLPLLTLVLATAPALGAQRSAPRLVVFLTVDQLRPDYFERFDEHLTGGLGRLVRSGATFMNGYQDHANTETAPGHAATMSGRFPYSTGIISNLAGVPDDQAPLISGSGPGASPYRFRGTTLIDWLRIRHPGSRALSVSRKDRGAILPLGRAKQEVYWYAATEFSTSTYYHDTLPDWVKQFNARRLPQRFAGQIWDLLLPVEAYAASDTTTWNSQRSGSFPYALPADSQRAAMVLPATPMMDEVTLAFALAGLEALQLGARPDGATDVLAISLSTMDHMGHYHGPDSREVQDHMIRLDRYLGAFLDSLFKLRDSTKVVIALTADHGVAPYPGARSRDPNAGAGFADPYPAIRAFLQPLRERGLDTLAVTYRMDMLYMDREAVRAHKLNPDSLERHFATLMLAVPGVMRADIVSQLARRDTVRDHIARRWLHMIPPGLPVAVVITLKPYWYYVGATEAGHGSPHDYDARVPVIFWGAGVKPGRHAQSARVVDMAPTLAAILGVTPLERLDGKVLRDVVR